MSYAYQAQTFSAARRNLMLPNAHGEAHSVFHAFNECIHGLHNLNATDWTTGQGSGWPTWKN